jgi:hypothetical protein
MKLPSTVGQLRNPRNLNFFTKSKNSNEADFLGFLQELVPHRSLTLTFEPFRFWLRIRGDIHNRKTTLRVGGSGFECLKQNLVSRRVDDTPTRGVAMVSRGVEIQIFKIFHHFKGLNQSLKRSIWQKKKPGMSCTITIDLFKGFKKIVQIRTLVDSPTRRVVF